MIRNLEWHAANGDILYFSNAPPFLLDVFYPGVPSAAAETITPVRVDGQRTYYVRAEPLTPSLTGTIVAQGRTYDEQQRNLDNLRRRLQSALNPKHFGTLIYNNYAGSFRLRCRPLSGAEIDKRFAQTHKIDIEWTSDDPYWTAKDTTALSVGVIKKMWVFPWVIRPTVLGSILSAGIVDNPTLIEIYPKIVISATESERVTVGNRATGDAVTITRTIAQGEKMELDMYERTVHLIRESGEREDVTHWTTPDSVFPWAVVPGNNEIYSSVDRPELSPIITLSWHRPEGGI